MELLGTSSYEDVSTQTTLGRSVKHSLGGRRYVQRSPDCDSVVQSAHCYMDDDGVKCSDVSLQGGPKK